MKFTAEERAKIAEGRRIERAARERSTSTSRGHRPHTPPLGFGKTSGLGPIKVQGDCQARIVARTQGCRSTSETTRRSVACGRAITRRFAGAP